MTISTKQVRARHNGNGVCIEAGEFLRLKYFYGQMLSAGDFQTEQNFFREKLKLHNRCLHGYGVVCGLRVKPAPMPKECDEKDQEEVHALRQKLSDLLQKKAAQASAAEASTVPATSAPATVQSQPPAGQTPAPQAPAAAPTTAQTPAPTPSAPPGGPQENLEAEIEEVRRMLEKFHKDHCKEEPRTRALINCGLAIDCQGNELVLREPLPVDLLATMSSQEANQLKHGARTIYLSVCYCEKEVDPVRPVLPEACGAAMGSVFGKIQESLRVQVSLEPPEKDHRCETCCEPCKECCLLLARIDCFVPGHPLHPDHIHNEVQRPIGLYDPATIAGINWRHGHTYTQEEARELLGTDDEHGEHHHGLEIHFSRPVRASTIRRGVLDVWVIEGGRGRSGNIYNKRGEFVHKPHDGYVERIKFRDTTRETLEPGDRVLITLRTDFILDRCCRSVDGENTGGRVPLLPEFARHFGHHHEEHHEEGHEEGELPHHAKECCEPPGHPGPWHSGNRVPGGTFESWFYIREDDDERDRDRRKVK
jgi:hypothetical protein